MPVYLRWPGSDTLSAARNAIRKGNAVEIELPLEMHYALYRQLHPETAGGCADVVDTTGDATLLAPVAAVVGLEDLRALQTTLRRARYHVRVRSPQPRLSLTPPDHVG